MPREQIISMLSGAVDEFADIREPFQVGNFVWQYHDSPDILPKLLDVKNPVSAGHRKLSDGERLRDLNELEGVGKIGKQMPVYVKKRRGLALAAHCLIGLGMYNGRLERRSNAGFYENLGIRELRDNGYPLLAKHFRDWTEYLGLKFGVHEEIPGINEPEDTLALQRLETPS